MLHGYGPAILAATPREATATAREIQAAVAKTPDLSTVRRHLSQLVELGCVQREGDGYRRLVDSELDLSVVA
jgi:DNA-binding IclR family transcriptional regulator